MSQYSSYITAVQGVYAGLTASFFPNSTRTPGPFLDEAPVTGATAERLSPPYVLIFDMGSDAQWTFTSATSGAPGQNGIVIGSFRLEAYDYSLGDCDTIIRTILWNGQRPNFRAGLAFATLNLTSPEKGIAGCVIPTRNQRNYAGFQLNNQRVHCTKQWFTIKTAVSGDGQ
jgi:hypothetical protein